MRLFRIRQGAVERLLWTRDSRLASTLNQQLLQARVIELADSGWCVIAPAQDLTQDLATRLAPDVACGLADVDPAEPPTERYLVALGQRSRYRAWATGSAWARPRRSPAAR